MSEPQRKEASAGLMEYSVENLVPFGPIHPALKEPEYFKLILEGEKIVQVIPRIGYVHRGLEKAAEQRPWVQNMYMFERTCGICSFVHSLCYGQAVEGLTIYEVPKRAKYLRLIIAELERIHSHLLWVGLMGHWAGFETLFMWVWNDRELVLDIVEAICGNRVHKSTNAICGVRRDMPENMTQRVVERMKYIVDRAHYYRSIIDTEETMLKRTENVGSKVSQETAEKLCAVGPMARYLGLRQDVRLNDPYAAYDEVPFDIVTRTEGDVRSLLRLRLDELIASANMVSYAVQHLPDGPIRVKIPPIIPAGEHSSHAEAPRGEIFYYVRSTGGRTPDRVKSRQPTMANIPIALELLKGQTLADVPMVLTAIDPCFGCMDRMSFLDTDTNKQWTWSGEQLRQYGIQHYFPDRFKTQVRRLP
ncbi:MAG TPA: nickel-dependent hydrogenase large subunit [Candidatus Acidoferrales bacterium]|nr:nickel-dependent hydrogenase large subunit [Candidatus Acidoferrales bacterium]